MKALKGILLLINRFFTGTPVDDVNYNNFEIKKMEVKYLRQRVSDEVRKNKNLELKLRTLKTV